MKDYTANWYFLNYKYDFLRQTAGRHDVELIEAHLHRLDKLKKHEKLTLPNSRKELYLSAIKYINELNDRGLYPEKYGKEEISLYLIILHEKNYFDGEELPDEVFDLTSPYNEIVAIPDIYGEYFLFYEYLNNELKRGADVNVPNQSNTENEGQQEEFKDIFLIIHRAKYDKIIDLLTQKNNVMPQCPFITVDGEKIVWETGTDGSHSFLAGLIVALKESGWIYKKSNAEYMWKVL